MAAKRAEKRGTLAFSNEERAAIVTRIQTYFVQDLDQEIGSIPAELLLKFFAEEIGGFFYNRGLHDAQAVVADRFDEINDTIYALESGAARVR